MGFKRETIEKWSFLYALTKPMVNFFYKTYFRVSTFNKQNIPNDGIVIFAPNHQNALMDALAVLATVPGQLVFLARADIFQNKLQNKILTFLKILPIYRIRDGKSNLSQNDAIFNKTIDVLKERKRLVILPEGNHAGYRRLRTIKKGIARIAFQAEELENYKLNIQIVPVTLDYGHYSKFHSRLFMSFGKAIPVCKYYQTYQENPPKAMNMLREDLAENLKKDIIHIESETYYDTINQLARLWAPECCIKYKEKVKQPALFKHEKRIVAALSPLEGSHPDEIKKLATLNSKYQELTTKLNFRDWQFRKDRFPIPGLIAESLLSILMAPLALYGWITGIVPYMIPVRATRKVKDPQFISSFRLVVALISFHVWYLLLFLLFCLITPFSALIKLAFLFSMPIAGFIAYCHYIGTKKNLSKWRFMLKKSSKHSMLKEARMLYTQLKEKMDVYC